MASRTPMTLRSKQPRAAISSVWSGRSHVSTFIRCLHLLDLDLLEDWPAINESTFTSGFAKQNQQNKVRATEWSLYRLFEIYNPEEARDKLRPFFPPTSPLQSVNLRAALYRCLGDLKKNGVLGAQYQLRKTMLDDCKGEKFEELIAGLAVIVLRRVTEQQATLVLDNNNNLEDDQLIPLILAHRSSLSSNLAQRRTVEKQLTQTLADVDQARRVLTVRKEEVSARRMRPDPALQEQMEHLINSNWVGNHAWATLLLKGLPPTAALDEVSLHLSSSKQLLEQSQTPIEDLITKLDNNTKKHRGRLAEWRVIAKDLQAKQSVKVLLEAPKAEQSRKAVRGTIRFAQHKQLDLRSQLPNGSRTPSMDQTYRNLLDAMQGEMATKKPYPIVDNAQDVSSNRISSNQDHSFKTLRTADQHRFTSTGSNQMRHSLPQNHFAQDSSHQQDDALLTSTETPSKMILDTPPPQGLDAFQVVTLETDATLPPHTRKVDFEEGSAIDTSPVSTIPDEVLSVSWSPEMEASTALTRLTSPTKVTERVPSPDGKINKSVETPTSPSTEWMSLMDRTRASMSGFGSYKQPLAFNQKEDNNGTQEESDRAGITDATPKDEDEGRRVTLVERTRQSMSLFSTTTTTKKSDIHRRKSQRMSQLFPINQFETPGKPRPRLSEFGPSSESSTPREKLFEEEADYESVFKSRPRIALSPTLSPDRSALGFDSILEEDLEGLQLASDDEYD